MRNVCSAKPNGRGSTVCSVEAIWCLEQASPSSVVRRECSLVQLYLSGESEGESNENSQKRDKIDSRVVYSCRHSTSVTVCYISGTVLQSVKAVPNLLY
jgi:hypothetical protein